MNIDTIGFIGCGNMGSILLKSFLRYRIKSKNIYVYDVDIAKLSKIKQENNVNISSDIRDLLKSSDLIVLAVKPNVIKDVLSEISKNYTGEIIMSIAAGIKISYIESFLSGSKVVRLMPNIPAQVGEGMIAFSYNDRIEKNESEFIFDLISSLGKAVQTDEKYMDAITGISGSGPAYVYIFIEALADAGVLAGLPRDLSYTAAAQTVLGSAKMVLETGKHPGELKDMVCSPAGTTIEAVRVLEKHGFRSAVIEAVSACVEKSKSIK